MALASYRAAYDHVRDIVLVIDAADGRIVEANREALEAYRFTRDELLARTIFDLRVAPADAVVGQMQVADRGGVRFDAVHRRADGSTFPVEVSSRGEEIEGRRYLVSILRDTTARKRADEERERLLETTRRALALRDEFLIVASHELRTPVTGIGLQLHQLRRMLERDAAHDLMLSSVDATTRELERLASLIGRLLDAQVRGGNLTLATEELDLGQLARTVADRLRIQADDAGCELTVDVPEIRGRWDRLRLEQVLTNLLVNAFKYGAGAPVTICGAATAGEATLEIRDRGIGIAEADAARIFEKFERAVPVASHGGLGLGLYIARQIVEAHGGHIEAVPRSESGATLRVTLPR